MFRPTSLSGKTFHRYLKIPAHPSKIRLQNIAGKKFFSNGLSIKNENGVLFTLDANDWITRIMLMEGDYEDGSTSLAKKILSNGGMFIDLGANFGLFTCIIAHNNNKVKAIAVEPNYKVIDRLLHNIRQNGLQESVQVVNAAVSNKFQLVTMEQPATDNLGTTIVKPGIQGLLSIPSCPLEFIFQENNISHADLIKIDIEGNEFDILENFPFEKYTIKNIILEFNHLSNISFSVLNTFLAGKGFKSFTITGEELLHDQQAIPENNIWFV
ncbi:MAG: FkbM family methyltransferase, partial [Ginsengibacter sp.]